MPLNDYEYSYRGLTFGGATNYQVDKESGILDMKARRSDRPFPRQHGFLSGKHLMSEKIIEIIIAVEGDLGSSDLADRIDAVMDAFNPMDYPDTDETNDKLVFQYPGFGEQFILCRPIRRTLVGGRTFMTELGVRMIAIQLAAYDPRRYSTTQDDSGVKTAGFSVTNDGDTDGWPVVVFTTDGSGNAKITNSATSVALELAGAGSSIAVSCDMGRRIRGAVTSLIVYSGATDYYPKWVAPRTPFYLAPGSNTITFDSGTNVRVYSRDVWS